MEAINYNVFLSWSGQQSKMVAEFLKELIEDVVYGSKVYFSDKDIKTGEDWRASIDEAIKSSIFGFVIMTKENQNSSWLNYEAGSLASEFDKRVSALLVNISGEELGDHPLKKYQFDFFNQEKLPNIIEDIAYKIEGSSHDKSRTLKLIESQKKVINDKIKTLLDYLPSEKITKENSLLDKIYSSLINQQNIINDIKYQQSLMNRRIELINTRDKNKSEYEYSIRISIERNENLDFEKSLEIIKKLLYEAKIDYSRLQLLPSTTECIYFNLKPLRQSKHELNVLRELISAGDYKINVDVVYIPTYKEIAG
jgi:hypothetical protein